MVGFDDVVDEVHADSGAVGADGFCVFCAGEFVKESVEVFCRDADASVRYGDEGFLFGGLGGEGYASFLGGVLDGVVDEVDEYLGEFLFVAGDVQGCLFWWSVGEGDLCLAGTWLEEFDDFVDDGVDVVYVFVEDEFACFEV